MRIQYNPKTAGALGRAPADDNITFDLAGRNIYVKGTKFSGKGPQEELYVVHKAFPLQSAKEGVKYYFSSHPVLKEVNGENSIGNHQISEFSTLYANGDPVYCLNDIKHVALYKQYGNIIIDLHDELTAKCYSPNFIICNGLIVCCKKSLFPILIDWNKITNGQYKIRYLRRRITPYNIRFTYTKKTDVYVMRGIKGRYSDVILIPYIKKRGRIYKSIHSARYYYNNKTLYKK